MKKSNNKLKRKNVGTCDVEVSKKQKISYATSNLSKGKDVADVSQSMKPFMDEVMKAIADSTRAAPHSPASKYKIAFKRSAQVLSFF